MMEEKELLELLEKQGWVVTDKSDRYITLSLDNPECAKSLTILIPINHKYISVTIPATFKEPAVDPGAMYMEIDRRYGDFIVFIEGEIDEDGNQVHYCTGKLDLSKLENTLKVAAMLTQQRLYLNSFGLDYIKKYGDKLRNHVHMALDRWVGFGAAFPMSHDQIANLVYKRCVNLDTDEFRHDEDFI